MADVSRRPIRRSGVVLAGGRSSRMGAPKALLDLGGEPMIRRVARALEAACDEIVLVLGAEACDDDEALVGVLRSTAFASRPGSIVVARDATPGLGPLAGAVAGLEAAGAAWAILVPCDLPLLAAAFVDGLFGLAECGAGAVATPAVGAPDAVVPRRGGHWEPLPAVFHRDRAGEAFRRHLALGRLRLSSAFEDLRILAVEEDQLRRLDPDGTSLLGVNDPAEFQAVQRRLAPRGQVGDLPPKSS